LIGARIYNSFLILQKSNCIKISYIRGAMRPFLLLLLVPFACATISIDLPKTKGTYDQCAQDTTVNNLAITVAMKYDSLDTEISHNEKVLVGIKNKAGYDYYKLKFYDYSDVPIIICAGYDTQLIFANKGYITKRIEITTSNIPAEMWAGGFLLDMTASMVKQPENFDESITEIPVARLYYDSTEQAMAFDIEYANERKQALDAAIEAAKAK
jgi:hypothetical protein